MKQLPRSRYRPGRPVRRWPRPPARTTRTTTRKRIRSRRRATPSILSGSRSSGWSRGRSNARVAATAGARVRTHAARESLRRLRAVRRIADDMFGHAGDDWPPLSYQRKDAHYRRRRRRATEPAAPTSWSSSTPLPAAKPGRAVVDLGAWPGGWLQVAAERVGPRGRVVGIDLVPIDPLTEPQVTTLLGDLRRAGGHRGAEGSARRGRRCRTVRRRPEADRRPGPGRGRM